MHPFYEKYKSGQITADEAVDLLISTLDETEAEITSIREALSLITIQSPNERIETPAATLLITQPGKKPSIKYDNQTVEAFRIHLMEKGHLDLANELAKARSLSEPRAGTLRITRKRG